MKRQRTHKIVIAAIAAAQIGAVSPVSAQSDEAIEAARRVNIAGRQRMLSQRMSKAACFISIGADAENQQVVLQDAFNLFSSSHEALRFGSQTAGLTAERNQRLLDALSIVSTDWSPFSGLVESALSQGYVAAPAVARIDETGLVLLGNMNKAVNKIANAYGEELPDMPLLLSLTIDLAGRQRMFSQKAAKEFCLIDAGINVEANQESLAKTTNLFTLTLDALISGMPGMVMAAPNDEIRAKLEAVSAAWAGPKAELDQAASGAPITDAQRATIVHDMENVLTLMNEAVGMYEEAIPEPE